MTNPSARLNWSHRRGGLSSQDMYTKMWNLAPDFGSLTTGGTAQQTGHIIGTISALFHYILIHCGVFRFSWHDETDRRCWQPHIKSNLCRFDWVNSACSWWNFTPSFIPCSCLITNDRTRVALCQYLVLVTRMLLDVTMQPLLSKYTWKQWKNTEHWRTLPKVVAAAQNMPREPGHSLLGLPFLHFIRSKPLLHPKQLVL